MDSFELLFANKAIVEILMRFFYAPEREFYQSLLVENTGLRLIQIQRGLKLLTDCGLLSMRKEGNRTYYGLNESHPALEDLMKLFMKMFMVLPRLKNILKPLQKNMLYCFIYGSMARNAQHQESDIDLFIVGNVGIKLLSQYLMPLSHELNKEINPHVYKSEEFFEKLDAGNSFIVEVVLGPRIWVLGDEKEFREMAARRAPRTT